MKEIRKIIIEREPGYVCSDIKEFEKITITPNSISYIYTHSYFSLEMREFVKENIRKWKYETNSPKFHNQYKKIITEVLNVMDNEMQYDAKDADMLTFILYDINNKRKKVLICSCLGLMKQLKKEIKKIIPKCDENLNIFL